MDTYIKDCILKYECTVVFTTFLNLISTENFKLHKSLRRSLYSDRHTYSSQENAINPRLNMARL